jgi:hypothetical protein
VTNLAKWIARERERWVNKSTAAYHTDDYHTGVIADAILEVLDKLERESKTWPRL